MDAVPRKRKERYGWYVNLSKNLTDEGPKMGLTPTETPAAKAIVDLIIASMDATDAASTTLDGAKSKESTVEATQLPLLRALIRNWKTRPAYAASGSEGVLKLKGSAEPAFDPATYKPVIKLSIEAGKIKVSFVKAGPDSLTIYMRLRGQTKFHRLAAESQTPYYDTTPLAVDGVPEVREFMARGMIDNDEIGLDSDIVSITFAG